MFKHRWSLAIPKALAAASVLGLVVASCGPSGSDETSCAETIADDLGDLEYGIIGTVIDDLSAPVAGAKVFVPGTEIEQYTDANGRFAIAAADLDGETTVQLWAEKDGYPDKVQEAQIPEDYVADVVMVMKPYTATDVIVAEEGGTVSDGQGSVTFQPDSLMYEDTGELVTGPVEVSIVTYRPYVAEDMKAAPGSLYGVSPERDDNGDPILDETGTPSYRTDPIVTFGMFDATMYQDGRRLELVPGKPATVVLENIVEGEHSADKIVAFNDENRDLLDEYVEPTIPLWHFNYNNANWDLVEDYEWNISTGSEGGYLTLAAEVPEFSPCNPDRPPVVCTRSIDIEQPDRTCVCLNVRHANDVEPVRGSDITLWSRAKSYVYLVVSCSDGTGSRTLVNTTMVTWFERAQTDQNGDFCGGAIVDPRTKTGSVRIDSTKTYWPGRVETEDIQYRDTEHDGELDDNGDGQIDRENQIGFLGDTYVDVWTRPLDGVEVCGPPDGVIHVRCINEPTDPVTGQQPQ